MKPVPSRVIALLPSLGRENDNEVLATAYAISRVLKRAGLDWHDVAQALEPWAAAEGGAETPTTGSPMRQPWNPASRPAPPYKPPKPRRPRWDDFRRSERIAFVIALLAETWLSAAERQLLQEVGHQLHAGIAVWTDPAKKAALTRLLTKASARGFEIRRAA